MQIYLAGINHNDPLCRARLEDWLKSLLIIHQTHPSFVAVEYDEIIFNKIKMQRSKLRTLAASLWVKSTIEFLDTLEMSLAFEADTHNSFMPEVETVWLDCGRTLPYPDAIEKYAIDRLNIYKNFIPENTAVFDTNLLGIMSVKAWDQSDKYRESATDRDAKFAEIIIKHNNLKESEWAIAIVGQKHASRNDGRMALRLEAEGFNCEIIELRPKQMQHNSST